MKLSEILGAFLILIIEDKEYFLLYINMPSSVVNHYLYFPETEVLRIIYQSGAIYDYLKVPHETVNKFKAAKSKGRFLNKVIKPRFKFHKIE